MKHFFHQLGEIFAEGILAIFTLVVHLAIGAVVLAVPAIAHPYVHWLYGEQPPMLVGTFSLVDAVHAFDYAVAFGIMGFGGWRSVTRFRR